MVSCKSKYFLEQKKESIWVPKRRLRVLNWRRRTAQKKSKCDVQNTVKASAHEMVTSFQHTIGASLWRHSGANCHENQPLTKCNDHNTRFGLTVYDTEGHHYRKGSTKIQRAFTYFDLHGCSSSIPSVIHFLPQNSELSYIFIRQMAVLITELPPFRISMEMAWDRLYTHTQ